MHSDRMIDKPKTKSNSTQQSKLEQSQPKSKSESGALSQRPKMKFYSRNMQDDTEEDFEYTQQNSMLGSPDVLDGFTAMTNGLQTSVLIANMMLTIGNIISDAN